MGQFSATPTFEQAQAATTAAPTLAAVLAAVTATAGGKTTTAMPGSADLLTLYKNTATTNADVISKLGTGQNLATAAADLTNLYTNSDFSDFLRVDRGYLNLVGNLELDTFAKAVGPAVAIYAAELAVVSNILATVAGALFAAASAVALYVTVIVARNDMMNAAIAANAAASASSASGSAGGKEFTFPAMPPSMKASLGSTFDSADMNGQMAKLDKAYGMLQQLQASYPKM
ncbi:MAG: hypothetical protein WDW38_004294 [Sanguina aurantia]